MTVAGSRVAGRGGFRQRSRLFWLSASWLFMLCIGSLLPARAKSALGTMGAAHDFLHLGAFGITSILLMPWGKTRGQQLGLAILAMVFGAVIEIAEGRLGGNPVELGDIALDILGVMLSVVLLQFRAARTPIEALVGARYRP